APARRVERLALLLHEPVELRLAQHPIQALVERMARRPRKARRRHPHLLIPSTASSQRHPVESLRHLSFVRLLSPGARVFQRAAIARGSSDRSTSSPASASIGSLACPVAPDSR